MSNNTYFVLIYLSRMAISFFEKKATWNESLFPFFFWVYACLTSSVQTLYSWWESNRKDSSKCIFINVITNGVNSVKDLHAFIWMPACFLLPALQLELSFNFTLNLMFQTNKGEWSGWESWGWEEKSSMAPFFLGMREHCMSWQVLSWFTSKSEK